MAADVTGASVRGPVRVEDGVGNGRGHARGTRCPRLARVEAALVLWLKTADHEYREGEFRQSRDGPGRLGSWAKATWSAMKIATKRAARDTFTIGQTYVHHEGRQATPSPFSSRVPGRFMSHPSASPVHGRLKLQQDWLWQLGRPGKSRECNTGHGRPYHCVGIAGDR